MDTSELINKLDTALNDIESLVDVLTELHELMVEMNEELEEANADHITEKDYVHAESIRDGLREDGISV